MRPMTIPSRRRWFQFGVRELILAVALLAVSAFAFRERFERQRIETESEALMAALEQKVAGHQMWLHNLERDLDMRYQKRERPNDFE
jgi:hypothetical protein